MALTTQMGQAAINMEPTKTVKDADRAGANQTASAATARYGSTSQKSNSNPPANRLMSGKSLFVAAA